MTKGGKKKEKKSWLNGISPGSMWLFKNFE
jgi:hypothetical protein